jgi:hypothetical protein
MAVTGAHGHGAGSCHLDEPSEERTTGQQNWNGCCEVTHWSSEDVEGEPGKRTRGCTFRLLGRDNIQSLSIVINTSIFVINTSVFVINVNTSVFVIIVLCPSKLDQSLGLVGNGTQYW